MKRTLITHLTLFFIAIIVVFGIALQAKIEVNSKEDLRTLSCGWPMEFIVNDQSHRDPPYPWKIECLRGSLGDPKISWQPFFINVIAFYFGFAFLLGAYRFTKRRKRM